MFNKEIIINKVEYFAKKIQLIKNLNSKFLNFQDNSKRIQIFVFESFNKRDEIVNTVYQCQTEEDRIDC